jgi:hypothetical protein
MESRIAAIRAEIEKHTGELEKLAEVAGRPEGSPARDVLALSARTTLASAAHALRDAVFHLDEHSLYGEMLKLTPAPLLERADR